MRYIVGIAHVMLYAHSDFTEGMRSAFDGERGLVASPWPRYVIDKQARTKGSCARIEGAKSSIRERRDVAIVASARRKRA